jgi:hypothetical protein
VQTKIMGVVMGEDLIGKRNGCGWKEEAMLLVDRCVRRTRRSGSIFSVLLIARAESIRR